MQEKGGEAPSPQLSSKKGREAKLGAQDLDVGPGANFPWSDIHTVTDATAVTTALGGSLSFVK